MSSVVTNTFGVAVIMVVMLTMREAPEINPTQWPGAYFRLDELSQEVRWYPGQYSLFMPHKQALDT